MQSTLSTYHIGKMTQCGSFYNLQSGTARQLTRLKP